MNSLPRVVVMVSGSGTNLQAIIDAKLQIEIVLVVSNRKEAYGLKRAEAAGIPFPASAWGKNKTFIQNVTVGWGVGHAAWLPDSRWSTAVLTALMWGSLAATVISGATYAMDARKLLGSGRV